MKKLTVMLLIAASALAGFGSTNEEWCVLHRGSMRYCSLTPTNMQGRAGLVVQRLGKTNTGVPRYVSAEIVRLFGGDEIDIEFAKKVDREFAFWFADASKGMFVLRERKFMDIWRRESAGDAD